MPEQRPQRCRVILATASRARRAELGDLLEAAGIEIAACGTLDERAELVKQHTPDAVVVSFAQGERISRLEAEGLNGVPALVVASTDDPHEEITALRAGAADYLHMGCTPAAIGERVLLRAREATAARAREESLEWLSLLSLTDEVSGLYNQRYLKQRLSEELERARRYGRSIAVIMLDIDNFKRVNDRTDHLVGSEVLRELGQLLRDRLRAADVVGRFGGDEFYILLPEVTLAGGLFVAERVRSEVAEHVFGPSAFPLELTITLGVAAYPESHTDDFVELLRLADRAMYAAKAAGRNRCAATPPIAEPVGAGSY